MAERILAITPCHNDGWAVSALAASMAAQQLRAVDWIIVDDNSDDDTPEQLAEVERSVPFATVLRRDRPPGRRIGEKARAVMAGRAAMSSMQRYDLVAILDADVVLPDDYFRRIAAEFAADPGLGVCGGTYREPGSAGDRSGRAAGHHVPGPAQVFRATVFDAVGGYSPLPFGGDDVESVTRARLLGWRTRPLHSVTYSHRRRMGTGGHGSALRADFNLGRQDHDLGTSPPFELVKILRHVTRRPVVLASIARLAGFVEGSVRRRPRSVDQEYVDYVRCEQRSRLRDEWRGVTRSAARVVRRTPVPSGGSRAA